MSAGRLALLSIVGLAACTAHHDIGAVRFTQTLSRDVDVLVVVDDSPAMTNTLPLLGRTLPVLAEAIQGSSASLHMGFITSDMGLGGPQQCGAGDLGAFESSPNCAVAPYLSWEGGTGNFVGTLGEAVTCLFPSTKVGCPVQQPFAAVRAALDPTHGTAPPGFLRHGADLVVVFLAVQDDCSLPGGANPFVSPGTGPDGGAPDGLAAPAYVCARLGVQCAFQPLPAVAPPSPVSLSMCESAEDGQLLTVADTLEFLRELKDDPRQVFAVVVAGPTTPFTIAAPINAAGPSISTILPTCQGDGLNALPPVRLQELVDKLGANGLSASLCGLALDSQLSSAALSISVQGKCLAGIPSTVAADASAGALPPCEVTFTATADAGASSMPIPYCATVQRPCFRLLPNAAECPGSGLEIDVTLGPSPLPPGSLNVDCLGTPPSE